MQICDVQKIYIPVGWSDTSTHNPRSQWFWYFYTFFLLWAIIWKESTMRINFWVSKLRRSSCRNRSHQSAPKGDKRWWNSGSASGTGRKMSDGRQRHISKIWQIWHTACRMLPVAIFPHAVTRWKRKLPRRHTFRAVKPVNHEMDTPDYIWTQNSVFLVTKNKM